MEVGVEGFPTENTSDIGGSDCLGADSDSFECLLLSGGEIIPDILDGGGGGGGG